MSAGEIIALASLAALVGAIVGAGVIALALRISWSRRLRRRAFARWLAARLAVSRACLALATALRAARCDGGSAFAPLRQAEVQRARNQWYAARHRLDLAIALLVADQSEPGLRRRLRLFANDDRRLFEKAVHGGAQDLDRLVRQLREADQQAIELFDAALPARGCGRLVRTYLRLPQVLELGRGIVESWRRP